MSRTARQDGCAASGRFDPIDKVPWEHAIESVTILGAAVSTERRPVDLGEG
jgi:hypothetical protein